MHKTVSIKVTGRVQGVFFRKFTLQAALKYQLCGYVKNAPDGSVIIQASGNEQNINSFIQWCHQGSPSSKVDKVIVEEVEPHTYIDFVIRY